MRSSTEWASYGHGKAGVAKACTDCHSLGVAHDKTATLSGGNPFRLGMSYSAPNTFCNNTGAGCHTTSGSVLTHSGALMTDAPYPQRTWNWTPKCYDCHDPHGDLTNLKMIRSDLYDNGSPIANSGSSTHGVPYTTDADLVDFTIRGGIANGSYADSVNANGICQECHTATLSFLDNDVTPLAGIHPTSGLSPCTSCHQHTKAFEPSGCENCHDGSQPPAPNVMTYWAGSDGSKQDGGHGDPQGLDRATPPGCVDCHDISQPAGAHGDGTLQSFTNGNLNSNTSHLKAEFFDTARSSPPPPVGNGTWSVQVAFDNYCAYRCHTDTATWVTSAVPEMRHERDTLATDANHWSVEFGTHLTISDATALPANYPFDAELNTNANAADVDYAPCVSCHDPHGTGVVEPTKSSNRMVRDNWISPYTLCNRCHI
jgi:hypothetical protein